MAIRACPCRASWFRLLSPCMPEVRLRVRSSSGTWRGSSCTLFTSSCWSPLRRIWRCSCRPCACRACRRGSPCRRGGCAALGGSPSGRSSTSRQGEARLRRRASPARRLSQPWVSLGSSPSVCSCRCCSGLLRMANCRRPSPLRTRAGAARSSTTRRSPRPWSRLRIESSSAGGSCSCKVPWRWLMVTPRARRRAAVGTVTSSSRLRCWADGTSTRTPNHSSSRPSAPAGLRLTPSCPSSTSSGSHSSPCSIRQPARWRQPLISSHCPWPRLSAAGGPGGWRWEGRGAVSRTGGGVSGIPGSSATSAGRGAMDPPPQVGPR